MPAEPAASSRGSSLAALPDRQPQIMRRHAQIRAPPRRWLDPGPDPRTTPVPAPTHRPGRCPRSARRRCAAGRPRSRTRIGARKWTRPRPVCARRRTRPATRSRSSSPRDAHTPGTGPRRGARRHAPRGDAPRAPRCGRSSCHVDPDVDRYRHTRAWLLSSAGDKPKLWSRAPLSGG
jgi:hypothetical protein